MPKVGDAFFVRLEFLTPDIFFSFETTPGGKLPFSLGGQSVSHSGALGHPFGVGHGIEPANVHDRVILHAIDRVVRAGWVLPVGALSPHPPGAVIVEGHVPRGRVEHHGTGHQLVYRNAGEIKRIRLLLCHRHVFGFVDKLGKLPVGDFCLIHPKPGHGDLVDGAFIRFFVIGTHRECAARDPSHVIRFESQPLNSR